MALARWALFAALAAGLTAYSFWLYLRVDLVVPAARLLAVARAAALVTVLTLLFDVRLPADGLGGGSTRRVLLDASLSMRAEQAGGGTAWAAATERADELDGDGWTVVGFGSNTAEDPQGDEPSQIRTLLVPALQRAAEAGAREVRVLSDMRFEDAVAVRAALESLPIDVDFERFGEAVVNAGISRLAVPDLARPDGEMSAEVEVHGGNPGDSISLQVLEEDRVVATLMVAAPSPGLRSTVALELPVPASTGRLRYSASVSVVGDAFASDDEAVTYASVGHEEGALVLVSLEPDWEPRYLLPVLQEVTGLPAIGFLRAGPDRFVRMGRAVDRGAPADSSAVRRATADAAVLVVHGIGGDLDDWTRGLVTRPGRKLLFVRTTGGAGAVGVETSGPRQGEWYASADIPASPIAGALSGVSLGGLPPLTDVLVPSRASALAPLLLQLRGAGTPEAAVLLESRPTGRVAVALSSGFWRWAMRESGREPYRRLWSGVAGWLLADHAALAAEPRPTVWVFAQGDPVTWSMPADTAELRIAVRSGDDAVVDTAVTGGTTLSTGTLPAGQYAYAVTRSSGDTVGSGRFDVAAGNEEMLPTPQVPDVGPTRASLGGVDGGGGVPLRTLPWPYLLIIALLCGEWIVRRRSGLR